MWFRKNIKKWSNCLINMDAAKPMSCANLLLTTTLKYVRMGSKNRQKNTVWINRIQINLCASHAQLFFEPDREKEVLTMSLWLFSDDLLFLIPWLLSCRLKDLLLETARYSLAAASLLLLVLYFWPLTPPFYCVACPPTGPLLPAECNRWFFYIYFTLINSINQQD